ncbi:MAG: hypothetical protein K2J11_00515, partial [Oscillospiraceae bacterium]|nr:hypothetical protein [Oscillospiraceae bacterium]
FFMLKTAFALLSVLVGSEFGIRDRIYLVFFVIIWYNVINYLKNGSVFLFIAHRGDFCADKGY